MIKIDKEHINAIQEELQRMMDINCNDTCDALEDLNKLASVPFGSLNIGIDIAVLDPEVLKDKVTFALAGNVTITQAENEEGGD